MMKKRVVVFPGQGSQQKGMGNALLPLFPEMVTEADQVLGYSIADLCLNDSAGQLNQTQFTQPALYVVNALTFLKKLGDTAQLPHFLAGHSLGEYDALFAAGVFDFATGLQLVKKRGQLMSAASGGAMAAIIGLTAEQIRSELSSNAHHAIDLANLNAPTQTVISGPEQELKSALATLEKKGAQIFPLKVSAAFHSRYMSDAQKEFEQFLQQFDFNPPQIPVIANVTAAPYPAESGTIKSILARQITSPVRWTETVEWFLKNPQEEVEFQETGPGNVLTGLIKRIRQAQANPGSRKI